METVSKLVSKVRKRQRAKFLCEIQVKLPNETKSLITEAEQVVDELLGLRSWAGTHLKCLELWAWHTKESSLAI